METELDSIKIETKHNNEKDELNKRIGNYSSSLNLLHFTGRSKELAYLKTLLETNQYVYIYGASGTGKTSLIHEFIKNEKQLTIRWVESSSLLNSFKCLADTLDINLGDRPKPEDLFHKIKLKLNQIIKSKKLSLLFIIDNLVYDENDEFLNDFKYLINDFNSECKFIITTKHVNFLKHLNHLTNNVQFELTAFDSHDCIEFIHKKLSKIHHFKLTNSDWIKIIMLKENKVLPLHLNRLLSRINQEIFWKTDNIKAYLIEATKTESNINHLLIKEENPKAFEILTYLMYLNQDSISLNFLKNLFNDISEQDLKKHLEYLNYNSEIIFFNDCINYSMNESIVKEQINLNKIINTLDNLISYDKINEYKLDSQMNEYFNHSMKILSIQDDEYTMFNIKKIQLIDKIAKINEIILCKYKKALELFEKSLNICQRTLPENHLLITLSLNNIGSIYYNRNEYDKALEYYTKSLSIYTSVLPANNCEIAECLNNIGSIYYRKNDFNNALDYFEKSLIIFQSNSSSNSSDKKSQLDVSTCFKNIASIYYKLNEYEKSLDYYEKSLKIKRELLPQNHFSIGVNLNNIGSIYYNKNEYDKALEYYEETLKIWNEILPADHPEVVQCFNNIGLVYFKKANYDRALEYYFKCLTIEKESVITENNQTSIATYYDNIGLIFSYKGDLDRAIECYENSLLIYKQTLPDKNELIVLTKKNIENLVETKRLNQSKKEKNSNNSDANKKKSYFKCCLFRF